MNVDIVMPTMNSRPFILDSLSSIQNVLNSNIFIFFCDNLSVDGTQDLIFPGIASKKLPFQYIGQLDSGAASAINAGFKLSQNEVIGWLNSDDLYAHSAIIRALKLFESDPNLKVVYGLGRHIDAAGNDLGAYPTLPPSSSIKKFADGSFICQPTVFFRREVFDEVGLLDESLKTAFDLDLWLRIFKRYRKNQIGFINRVQAYSRLHDQCLTKRFRQTVALESMQVIAKHLGSAPGHWILTYFDELCERYPFIEEKESLLEITKSVLGKAKAFMKPAEFATLVKTLQNDSRLKLANAQAFIDVQPDGWVSKKLIAKLRYKKGGKRTLVLKCQGGWPTESNIQLTIRSATGEIEKIKLGSQDEFILTLEAPETNTEAFTAWVIETRQFFVPAKVQKRSKDSRKLSFRVDSLLVQ
ncbi:glycosyltransferase [Polynucleobacter paneuropaeus]|uniref:Glycosyltransferase n=1 Tax=Polynucleobacter paneuropaeus TaxID=2527775 RepID=A0A9Q2ZTN0_9BURK|nr:glycosyltransferase [Polynucleobacter paneuropaeus]